MPKVIQKAAEAIQQEASVAVYPCCGFDTKPFTFLHRDFLAYRNADKSPAPNIFVYIDSLNTGFHCDDCFNFSDGRTEIRVLKEEESNFLGLPAKKIIISHSFLTPPEWCKTPTRNIVVLFLKSEWERIPSLFYSKGFEFDLFIGVTDGCRWGGNEHCVNNLETYGLPRELLENIFISKFYVTDHFSNARVPPELKVGEDVESLDIYFPYAFRKIAFLSSEWGNYGRGAIGGATLFETIKW